MQAGVIVFPGSNCDRDVAICLEAAFGQKPKMIWHGDSELPPLDVIVIPGGFSYGDYLRCGAMAAHSKIMQEVIKAAKKGVLLLGICNGFQILIECGLLPGILMRNQNMHFICKDANLMVENSTTPFTHSYKQGQHISLPIAHNEGNYFADDETLKELEGGGQIVFRYQKDENPNGSRHDIAAIINRGGNILGMMPHPERFAEPLLGGIDGKAIFTSLAKGGA